MDKETSELMTKAMMAVLAMIRTNCKPDEALKFSQSALNLAQVQVMLAKK